MENCVRCGETAEFESEFGFLCNDCDCVRISIEDNPETKKTIKEFEKECSE